MASPLESSPVKRPEPSASHGPLTPPSSLSTSSTPGSQLDAKNYGICSSCLTPALGRLGAKDPGPSTARRVRRPAQIAVVPGN